MTSPGYRTVQLPLHWPRPGTDSVSFRVVIPLVAIDKPTGNQPYFQSEQRPLRLLKGDENGVRRSVQFQISDALTNQPVRASLCLFSTKEPNRRCYQVSSLQAKVIASDIVAIEVRAAAYQRYLGNVVIEDTAGPTILTIRLNPTPTLLVVTVPASSEPAGWRLSIVGKSHTYPLTALDSTHFLVAAPSGRYRLIGKAAGNRPIDDTLQLAEGLTGYASLVVPTMANEFANGDTALYFAQSSYALSDSARQTLDRLARMLQHFPQKTVRIIGHTDNVGNAQLNLTLSEFRAKIALAYLRQHGISEVRLHSEAAGMKQPAAPNDTEENRRRNRRVSLHIR